MQLFFPFVVWLAAGTSVALTVMLWAAGDLRPRGMVVAIVWLLVAGYLQFFSGSAVTAAVGLVLQTLLAISLIVRWRFTEP